MLKAENKTKVEPKTSAVNAVPTKPCDSDNSEMPGGKRTKRADVASAAAQVAVLTKAKN